MQDALCDSTCILKCICSYVAILKCICRYVYILCYVQQEGEYCYAGRRILLRNLFNCDDLADRVSLSLSNRMHFLCSVDLS